MKSSYNLRSKEDNSGFKKLIWKGNWNPSYIPKIKDNGKNANTENKFKICVQF